MLVWILDYVKLYHFYCQLQEKDKFLANPDRRPETTWDGSGIAVKHKSNRTAYGIRFQDELHFWVTH